MRSPCTTSENPGRALLSRCARAILLPLSLAVALGLGGPGEPVAASPAPGAPAGIQRPAETGADPAPASTTRTLPSAETGGTPTQPIQERALPRSQRLLAQESGGLVTGESIDWLRHARVAGLGLHETASDALVDEELARLVTQGVSVLEADSSLSDYLSEEDFTAELEFIKRVVARCHAKGLKVVWYYPSMEVITPEGRTNPKSMQRVHPEWVQKNFDRRTMNVFFGTLAFWVEPNDESAWMCPNSPYRQFFYERIARLAGTGLDGIWLDVPLFNSIVGKWPCADSHCMRKFEKETGLKFPTSVNLGDARFRAWVRWRHQTLADFLAGAHLAGKAVNPTLRTVVEVVSCDHMINTLEGLDATWFAPDLDIVWEVDALSDTTSMVHASKDDWLTMMAVYKYCQGASQQRSRWVFTYGFRDADAQLVMASALAAQCNPYETRIPQMVTSVGSEYRTRMFRWIEQNTADLFASRSSAPVAVLYSDTSRDFVDGTKAGGFYVSPAPPSPAIRWWVLSPELSVMYTTYLSEYRGWAMMLIGAHIPFDILTCNQLDAGTLGRYKAVVVPGARSLSDAQVALLKTYAEGGGTLVVTGDGPATMDETGARRKTSPWAAALAQSKSEGPNVSTAGQGRIVAWHETPGSTYVRGASARVRDRAAAVLEKAGVTPFVQGDAPVYVQSYDNGGRTVLHLVHYGWVGRPPLRPKPVTTRVSLPWSGTAAGSVTMSEPGDSPKAVPARVEGGRLVFEVPVRINALVTVEGSK